MHQTRKSRSRCRLMVKCYVAPMLFPLAFMTSVSVQGAGDGGEPDVVDVTETLQIPDSVDTTGSLSEPENNLIQSAYQGDLPKLKVLVAKGGDVNIQAQKKRTPLILAASNGHTSAVEFLISQGAEVNAKDSGGQTALMYAAKRSFNETAALLLKNGAEVNIQSKKKRITALMLAAVWDNVELLKMLLEHGADPHLTDIFGRTAKVLAEKKGNSAVLELLPDPPPQESGQ